MDAFMKSRREKRSFEGRKDTKQVKKVIIGWTRNLEFCQLTQR
jgi:hypothetical protein